MQAGSGVLTSRRVQGTDSKHKHELLYSRFGTNYNDLPEQFRKGSVLVRMRIEAEDAKIGFTASLETEADTLADPNAVVKSGRRPKAYEGLTGEVVVSYEDIIGDRFWDVRPWLLC